MEAISKVLGFLFVLFLAAILFTLPTMWLWNWLMPDLFNICEISFWQALGLNFLASILFKSNSSN